MHGETMKSCIVFRETRFNVIRHNVAFMLIVTKFKSLNVIDLTNNEDRAFRKKFSGIKWIILCDTYVCVQHRYAGLFL